jgi:hypothetical protein
MAIVARLWQARLTRAESSANGVGTSGEMY